MYDYQKHRIEVPVLILTLAQNFINKEFHTIFQAMFNVHRIGHPDTVIVHLHAKVLQLYNLFKFGLKIDKCLVKTF